MLRQALLVLIPLLVFVALAGGGILRALPGRLLSSVLRQALLVLRDGLEHDAGQEVVEAALLRLQDHRAQLLRDIHHHHDHLQQPGTGKFKCLVITVVAKTIKYFTLFGSGDMDRICAGIT